MQKTAKEKLYFPPRLMDTLADICNYPVTVVSAPSGSGKTTAVREFLARRQKEGTRVLWYTAFGETPGTAWERICKLLGKVDSGTASLLYALDFPVRQTLSALAEVVPQLRCEQETVFVVDNSQLFKSRVPYELVCALAQHGCAQFHLVIISQNPMEAPAHPMSAAGVLFLDAAIFFFSEEDAAGYFLQNGAVLTQAELDQVMENTLGWAAALRLQLLGYRQTGCIQKENGIHRLMRTALWETFSEEEKYFLLAISQMESVTIRQACTLLDCRDIPEYGIQLLERGGFIQYDPQSHCYALHTLLREFLIPYFDELPRSEQKRLRARAGRAYLLTDMYFFALRMLFLSEAYEEMLCVPIANVDMVEYGADEVVPLLKDVVATCPPELLYRHPGILLRFAFEALMRGEDRLYGEYCSAVHRALKVPDVFDAREKHHLRGEYIFLRSFTMGNNLEKMNAAHKAALKILGGPSHAFDVQHYWTFGVPSILAQYWSNHASLPETLDVVERGLSDYLTLTRGCGTGAAELMRAEALLNAGRLDDAEVLCHKAGYVACGAAQDSVCFGAELTLGRISVMRGDAEGYTAYQESIRQRRITGRERARHLLADQCAAFLGLALGRSQDVPSWLQNETEIQNHMYKGGVLYGMLLLGKYLLLQKDYNHLLGLADPVLAMARERHALLPQVYYLLYLACAKQATGMPEEAQCYLRQALDIALPENIYLPFAEHAVELAAPLAVWENIGGGGRAAVAIRRLAKLCRTGAARVNRTLYGASRELTAREEEIAHLAKQGLSNKQIAENLYISPETVKKTLKNVFVKLEVKSRRQLEEFSFR